MRPFLQNKYSDYALFVALNSNMQYHEVAFAKGWTGVRKIDPNWNEIVVIIGTVNNKFNFYITAQQVEMGYGDGLSSGFNFGNKDCYCVINVAKSYIQNVAVVVNGVSEGCDLLAYAR